MESVKVREEFIGIDVAIVKVDPAGKYAQYSRLIPPLAVMGAVRSAVSVVDTPDIDPADLPIELRATGGVIGFGPAAQKVHCCVNHTNAAGTCGITPVLFAGTGGDCLPIGILAEQTSTASLVAEGATPVYHGSVLSWDIPFGIAVGFLVTTISASNTVNILAGVDDQGDNLTVGSWAEKTDDSFWSAYQSSVTWSGIQWDAVYVDPDWVTPLRLIVAGSWYVGYTPTRVRVTYTAGVVASNFNIKDGWNSDDNVDVDDYVSTAEEDLTFFPSGDLDVLRLSFVPSIGAANAAITKIEFFESFEEAV